MIQPIIQFHYVSLPRFLLFAALRRTADIHIIAKEAIACNCRHCLDFKGKLIQKPAGKLYPAGF